MNFWDGLMLMNVSMSSNDWILEGNLYGEGDIKSRYFYSYIIICKCECVKKRVH